MLEVKERPAIREHADKLDSCLRVAIALLEDRDLERGHSTEVSARIIAESKALIAKGLPR